jgi:hypothetical protein
VDYVIKLLRYQYHLHIKTGIGNTLTFLLKRPFVGLTMKSKYANLLPSEKMTHWWCVDSDQIIIALV